MLEEDAAKFDAFLKDNDAAVQDAQRRADAETAARQVKVRAVSPADAPVQLLLRLVMLPSARVALQCGALRGFHCGRDHHRDHTELAAPHCASAGWRAEEAGGGAGGGAQRGQQGGGDPRGACGAACLPRRPHACAPLSGGVQA